MTKQLYIKTDGPLPWGCDYITVGKVYELLGPISRVICGSDFVDDKGRRQHAYIPNSAHLGHKPWILCDELGNPVPAPWEWEKAAETSAQPPAWQFLQDGEWHTGMNTNDHRRRTEAAGYPTRDLWPINYRAHAEALADALKTVLESFDMASYNYNFPLPQSWGDAHAALAAFDQDRGE